MNHTLHLPERPFRAIQNGTKKVEGRSGIKYKRFKPGDLITFIQEDTKEKMTTEIVFIHHYPDVNSMLVKEGVENVLSSFPKTIKHGIESYHSISNYETLIKKYGIYAIGLK